MNENPYESPQVPDPAGSPKPRSAGRIAFAICLGLLAIPAGAIAFFTTCLVTLGVSNSMAPLYVGGVAGIAVIIGMCVLAVRVGRTPPK